jgi:hypothetical protein
LSFAAGAGVGARFLRLWLRRRPPLLFFFLLSLNASYRPDLKPFSASSRWR